MRLENKKKIKMTGAMVHWLMKEAHIREVVSSNPVRQ